MNKLNLAFFGTPEFVAEFLEKILNDKDLPVETKLVVTQPDKPVGKKKVMTPSPVKELAQRFHIPVVDRKATPDDLKDIDIVLLFAFGEIIPQQLLEVPKYGFWNVHPSLLPKYRGASPTTYPLLLGDNETAVSLMQMDKQLDHGPIIAQDKMPIDPDDRRPEFEKKLAEVAFLLFKNAVTSFVKKVEKGTMPTFPPQDHEKATFTRMYTKRDSFIQYDILKNCLSNISLTSEEIPLILKEYSTKSNSPINNSSSEILYNLFRGFYPWPGVWTTVKINGQEKRLKLLDMKLTEGKVTLTQVQLEGKNPVDFKTFNTAYKLF